MVKLQCTTEIITQSFSVINYVVIKENSKHSYKMRINNIYITRLFFPLASCVLFFVLLFF